MTLFVACLNFGLRNGWNGLTYVMLRYVMLCFMVFFRGYELICSEFMLWQRCREGSKPGARID